jgi:serine/tyrosine/threonine adenylyltransferase
MTAANAAAFQQLHEVEFENTFTAALPGDPSTHNVPRLVPDACYSRVTPTPVAAPRLLAWSEELGILLGIARPEHGSVALALLAGNRVLAGMTPYAARYGGHQFGRWAGQLGDGRAITLAEVVRDGQRWELQLKGAGRTPYSRTADGRAVLRSSLREFLCSEAMHHLGVPTTRALSLVETGEAVLRDMFYDGNVKPEPGAVVCRVAPSFVRFGNFELASARREYGLMRQLADYVIAEHFPEIDAAAPDRHAIWFEEICRRTALMVAHWMRVGFVHGVMNTDNMSVLGLTIDYGPYGWLEDYDPGWTPNTTDAEMRRYCFGNQPQIAYWNIAQLANAIFPLVQQRDALERALDVFRDEFQRLHASMQAAKLGLERLEGDADRTLVAELFVLLHEDQADMTILFRRLAGVPTDAEAGDEALLAPLTNAFYGAGAPSDARRTRWLQWLRRWGGRVRVDAGDPEARVQRMQAANPKYVLRNYLAQLAIEAAESGDLGPLERLQQVLRRPYDEQPAHEDLAQKRPDWALDKPGCSALSCSS